MKTHNHYHNIIEKSKFVPTDRNELLFRKTVKRMFKDYEYAILKGLSEINNKQETKKSLGDFNLGAIFSIALTKIQGYVNKFTAVASNSAQQGADKAYHDMGISLAWDINMTPIVDFYRDHYREWMSDVVGKGVQEEIKDVIAEGIRDGESIDDISKKIKDFFEHPITVPEQVDEEGQVTRKAYQIDKDVYAETVARSEVSGAVNNGRLFGYSEGGLVKTVRWFSNPGACELCVEEHGQVYTVAEAQGLIPKHPNCRCTWLAEEYGEYKEEEDKPNILSEPEKIVADPHGVGIMDFMKMTEEQTKQVEKLLDKEQYKEAIKLMHKFTGYKG